VLPKPMRAPVAATDCGSMALTVAAVPTGMKHGVLDLAMRRPEPPQPRRAGAGEHREGGDRRSCRAADGVEEARIAVGVEAVAFAHGVVVGRFHPLEPGEAETSMKRVERGR